MAICMKNFVRENRGKAIFPLIKRLDYGGHLIFSNTHLPTIRAYISQSESNP